MKKSRFFTVGMLVMILAFGITVIGCSTTQYRVEISNVPNIAGIYIRNAGETNWGQNIYRQNLDRSKYSETVDIKVIGTDGLVYSKYNVPFNNVAFVETNKESSMNLFAQLLICGGGLIAVLLLL